MPRKSTSTGKLKSNDKTSLRLKVGSKKSPRSRKPDPVPDGGKWAGSGRKTVQRTSGPALQQQGSTGRGRKTRTIWRSE
jgi:hypothetical protein